MNEQEKWKDPRVPVNIKRIGKFTVTIYDQAAYEQSLKDYPDNPNEKLCTSKANDNTRQYTKQKSASRYNWTYKLPMPLLGTVPRRGVSSQYLGVT